MSLLYNCRTGKKEINRGHCYENLRIKLSVSLNKLRCQTIEKHLESQVLRSCPKNCEKGVDKIENFQVGKRIVFILSIFL
jgi:hypothetical protein